MNNDRVIEVVRESLEEVKKKHPELWRRAFLKERDVKQTEKRRRDWEREKEKIRAQRRAKLAGLEERDYFHDSEGEFANSKDATSRVNTKGGQFSYPSNSDRKPCGRRNRKKTCKTVSEEGSLDTAALQAKIEMLLKKYATLERKYKEEKLTKSGMSYADCLRSVDQVVAATDGKLKGKGSKK